MAQELMRIFLYFLLIITFTASAEIYKCEHHPDWPDDRKFTAKIQVITVPEGLEAKILEIELSEPWPLNKQCDSPLNIGSDKMEGWDQGIEAKFWMPNNKECSFMIYLTLDGDDPTMLSPRKTFKVFGERPYLAMCKAI